MMVEFQDEPGFVAPADIEYWITHLLQPLVTKITDLEVQVTTLSTQAAQLQTAVDGFKLGKVAKFLGVT